MEEVLKSIIGKFWSIIGAGLNSIHVTNEILGYNKLLYVLVAHSIALTVNVYRKELVVRYSLHKTTPMT